MSKYLYIYIISKYLYIYVETHVYRIQYILYIYMIRKLILPMRQWRWLEAPITLLAIRPIWWISSHPGKGLGRAWRDLWSHTVTEPYWSNKKAGLIWFKNQKHVFFPIAYIKVSCSCFPPLGSQSTTGSGTAARNFEPWACFSSLQWWFSNFGADGPDPDVLKVAAQHVELRNKPASRALLSWNGLETWDPSRKHQFHTSK